MQVVKGQYLVDAQGHPKAVVLGLQEYRRILRLLEDLEDAAYIRRHRHERLIPMATVHRQLKKEGLV